MLQVNLPHERLSLYNPCAKQTLRQIVNCIFLSKAYLGLPLQVVDHQKELPNVEEPSPSAPGCPDLGLHRTEIIPVFRPKKGSQDFSKCVHQR